jgi:O-antigen/teichoic acid export membrane protein
LPRVSSKITRDSLIAFLKKCIAYSALIAVLLIPFVFAGSLLIRVLQLQAYIPAIPVFTLTGWDHIVMVLFTPLMIALLAINRPKLIALLSACEMILNIIGDLIFVPDFGAVGAAAVTLATRIFMGSVCAIYLWHRFKHDPEFVREVF